MARQGVVIANTGSPQAATGKAVGKYLKQFLNDPHIRPMNPFFWNIILRSCILPRRSEASAKKYELIWTDEGSPLAVNMLSLERKLEKELNGRGKSAVVRYAMSYGHPSIHEALLDLRCEKCDEVTVIPMYPQSAFSTTSVVKDRLDDALEHQSWHPAVHFVESYHDNGLYIDAITQSLLQAGFAPNEDMLMFAFHSVPMKDIEAGDVYEEQTQETVEKIKDRLGIESGMCKTGYQCRFDKGRAWLQPYACDVLEELDEWDGRLFAIAPNFSIDCLETLYDIDHENRGFYESRHRLSPKSAFVYVPCLNDSDAHVSLLASMVR